MAARIWYFRTLHAIRDTSKQRRLFVFFEDYFDKKSEQINKIAAFVGKDGSKINTVSEDMRHYDITLQDLIASPEIPSEVKLFYILLLRAKKDDDFADVSLFSNVVEEVTMGDGSGPLTYNLESELEYYKKIANHPYVRFGRRISKLARTAKTRLSLMSTR